LRSRLGWAGFGAPSPGVWISPNPEREAEASDVLKELDLAETSTSFVGEFSGIGEVDRLVAQAWDVPDLERRYEEFLTGVAIARPRSQREAFVALTNLVHEWRRFPFLDPDLPPELLPDRWSGDRAAEVFHRLHTRWRPKALAWWTQH
jgi:phenylacetic acid degradation operon negative regulatory protein